MERRETLGTRLRTLRERRTFAFCPRGFWVSLWTLESEYESRGGTSDMMEFYSCPKTEKHFSEFQ